VTREPGLSHLFLTVADLAEARRFWTEAIGLDVLVEDDEYLRVGGGFSMGIERAAEGDEPEVEVVVRVADVDESYARLQALGVACDGPPEEMPWGARHVWLRGPDGRRISLYSSDHVEK
jgi:catechol 2,3-dioxygenase-like lactoylglutathione lyase family enzyme